MRLAICLCWPLAIVLGLLLSTVALGVAALFLAGWLLLEITNLLVYLFGRAAIRHRRRHV